MKPIKEIVQKRLLEIKLSAGDFAELIGINQPSLNKIYQRNSTTPETLEKMAKALRISIAEFFEESYVLEEPQAGYTTIKNEELIELQKLALGNIKRELEQSKNIKDVSVFTDIDIQIP